jgi:hypothetical protein
VHRGELVRLKKALRAAAVSKSETRSLRGLDDHGLVHRCDGVAYAWVKLGVGEPRHRLLLHSTKHECLCECCEDRLLLRLEGHDWLRYPTCVNDGPTEAVTRSNI